jgi:hypothetical protein
MTVKPPLQAPRKALPPLAQSGLGDLIARAALTVGVQPCDACRKRREALNKLMPLGSKRK